jgi:ABC-type sugar transport system ATPase subunit
MTGRTLHVLHEGNQATRSPRAVVKSETPPILRVTGLTAGRLADVDLTIQPGEVVGVAGVETSGKTDLMECLYGLLRRDAGEVELAGKRLKKIDPARQLSRGVIYLPKERLAGAVIPSFSISRNISLVSDRMPALARERSERAAADEIISKFKVRAHDARVAVANLSGGNQQKVALCKWLERRPRLLLLDNPTRGVDVGAREDIYAALREAVNAGAGVLVASDELEELISICDRVYVMREGRVAIELDLEAGPGADDGLDDPTATVVDRWRRRIVKEMV